PEETLFVLISDLYEGGIRDDMLRRVNALKESGVQVLVLLALPDDGAPAYDHDNAAALPGRPTGRLRITWPGTGR
ncbi:VWA domain-containing protein, partial [Nocardia cyriacigeorgica]|uniref:VWA domain-containing protein n=1 Tax=Nocardia cyriacigeorgica TaxID=135487 RepID=UPI002455C804